jgi:hypothetical protein
VGQRLRGEGHHLAGRGAGADVREQGLDRAEQELPDEEQADRIESMERADHLVIGADAVVTIRHVAGETKARLRASVGGAKERADVGGIDLDLHCDLVTCPELYPGSVAPSSKK